MRACEARQHVFACLLLPVRDQIGVNVVPRGQLELWWILPASVLFSTIAVGSGVSGALFFSPFFMLVVGLAPVQAVGAGHFMKDAGDIRRLDSDNRPIGLFEGLSQTCSMLKTPFLPGDRLVLYTDGITESTSPDGSDLGVDGLERYVAESAHRPLGEFAEAIRRRVEEFRGGARAGDDELLLAIAHLEAEG